MRLQLADIPEALAQAHEQSRLVLFVGAGVSCAAPSCLPLFDELADRIAQEVGAPHEDRSLSAEQRLEELAGAAERGASLARSGVLCRV